MMDASEIILSSDKKAAEKKTVTGWISRRGFFFGDDERLARADGCTHHPCPKCGKIIPKSSYCRECHAKAEIEKYKQMGRQIWNGTDALYSQALDKYFFDAESLEEYCDDEETAPESLLLIICKPNYAQEIEPSEYYNDDLPDDGDGEIPVELEEAFDELNQQIRTLKIILSWSPGKYAADLG